MTLLPVGTRLTAFVVVLCGIAAADVQEIRPTKIDLSSPATLQEGQTAAITGTNIAVKVLEIRDFTSEGCLGGPAGCPDHVRLQVSRGAQRQSMTLHRDQRPSQKQLVTARAFGYTFTITALHEKKVTLLVTQKNQ
jgi:hypothetical protein